MPPPRDRPAASPTLSSNAHPCSLPLQGMSCERRSPFPNVPRKGRGNRLPLPLGEDWGEGVTPHASRLTPLASDTLPFVNVPDADAVAAALVADGHIPHVVAVDRDLGVELER